MQSRGVLLFSPLVLSRSPLQQHSCHSPGAARAVSRKRCIGEQQTSASLTGPQHPLPSLLPTPAQLCRSSTTDSWLGSCA